MPEDSQPVVSPVWLNMTPEPQVSTPMDVFAGRLAQAPFQKGSLFACDWTHNATQVAEILAAEPYPVLAAILLPAIARGDHVEALHELIALIHQDVPCRPAEWTPQNASLSLFWQDVVCVHAFHRAERCLSKILDCAADYPCVGKMLAEVCASIHLPHIVGGALKSATAADIASLCAPSTTHAGNLLLKVLGMGGRTGGMFGLLSKGTAEELLHTARVVLSYGCPPWGGAHSLEEVEFIQAPLFLISSFPNDAAKSLGEMLIEAGATLDQPVKNSIHAPKSHIQTVGAMLRVNNLELFTSLEKHEHHWRQKKQEQAALKLHCQSISQEKRDGSVSKM